jgi:hypothetical protein
MPEASFSDLQNAIAGFNNQVQSYAVQSAVTNASQRVQELQSAQLDEVDKRNQTQQLSQQLALQLTGLGADANQVQSAVAATAPKQLNTFGDMYAEGLNKNSEPLKQNAKELKKFMNEDKLAMAELKYKQDSMKMLKKQSLQMDDNFRKLVPKVQENFNKATKVLNEKLGQINLVEGLPTGAPKDRIDLTTIVKSVGQDVGAIGDKEADAVLPPSMASQFKSLRNYITGKADSIRTKEQADAMKKVFKQAKPMLQKIIDARAKQYGYQLSKSAKLMGHELDINEAVELMQIPDYSGEANSSPSPSSSSDSQGAPAFDIRQFMTPINPKPEAIKPLGAMSSSNKL